MLVQNTQSLQYEQEVLHFMKHNPTKTYNDAINSIAIHTVPDSIPGTPAWHKQKLNDLKAIVNKKGLPHLFHLLTSDDTSDTRWCEIDSLEVLLQQFGTHLNWHDAPCEHAELFHKRLHDFLHAFVFDVPGSNRIFGRVNFHVTRLECQQRGSLHAHIMLWLEDDDMSAATNAFTAHIPEPMQTALTWTACFMSS